MQLYFFEIKITTSSEPTEYLLIYKNHFSLYCFIVAVPQRIWAKRSVTCTHLYLNTCMGVSPLTGSKSSNPAMSSILSHLDSTGHTAPLLMILRLFLVALLQRNSSFDKVFSLTNSNPLSTYKAVLSLYFYSDLLPFLLL